MPHRRGHHWTQGFSAPKSCEAGVATDKGQGALLGTPAAARGSCVFGGPGVLSQGTAVMMKSRSWNVSPRKCSTGMQWGPTLKRRMICQALFPAVPSTWPAQAQKGCLHAISLPPPLPSRSWSSMAFLEHCRSLLPGVHMSQW